MDDIIDHEFQFLLQASQALRPVDVVEKEETLLLYLCVCPTLNGISDDEKGDLIDHIIAATDRPVMRPQLMNFYLRMKASL